MPNRLIKDSINDSEKISALSDFQFRVWVHLITYVDDYGRGDARPAIIKGKCFPLRDRMTNRDIEAALTALAGAGCVSLYTVDGRPYLYFPNWESHQRVRQKISKCPPPPPDSNPPQSAASCGELRRDAADCGEVRPESRILNTESRIQNPNPEETANAVCAEPPAGRSTPSEPSGFSIPLNDGSEYNVPLADVEKCKRLYPGVDVEAELRGMIGWSIGNPANRKTKMGVNRFIHSWLKRCQDRSAAAKQSPQRSQAKRNPAQEYEQREYDEEMERRIMMNFEDLTGGGAK